MCIQYPQRPEAGIRYHGMRVADGCELPDMGARK